MALPKVSKNKIELGLQIAFGCFWALLTGSFFALPGIPSLVGAAGIAIALAYSGAVCLLGKRAIWLSIGLTAAAIAIFLVVTRTSFSVVNYAVFFATGINFLVFGFFGVSLQKIASVRKTWFVTAIAFGGSLGLGWLLGAIAS